MDLSKLPKLSDTRAADNDGGTPVTPVPAVAEPFPPHRPTAVGLAETWLSIGVGLFVLLFWPRFLQWASSRVLHTHFDEFVDSNGAIVPYQTLGEFWSDLGPTLLGVVLVVDGLLLFTRRPALIVVAMGLTLLSTIFNLIWLIVSFGKYGLAPLSFLAVFFGGFILMTQWHTYKNLRVARPSLGAS
jgi:hypothetical protein